MHSAAEVWIGIGCNMPPRGYRWRKLVSRLENIRGLEPLAWSKVVPTPAVGPQVRGQFWNAVLHARSTAAPLDLLDRLKFAERRLGRRGRGNRPADFDILWWREDHYWRTLYSYRLVIPHPQAKNRNFVLAPLATLPDPHLLPAARALSAWKRRVAANWIATLPTYE